MESTIYKFICLPTNGITEDQRTELLRDAGLYIRDFHVYHKNSTTRLVYNHVGTAIHRKVEATHSGITGISTIRVDGEVIGTFEFREPDARVKIQKDYPGTKMALQAITGGWLALRSGGWTETEPNNKHFVYAMLCKNKGAPQTTLVPWLYNETTIEWIQKAREHLRRIDSVGAAATDEELRSKFAAASEKVKDRGVSLVGTKSRFEILSAPIDTMGEARARCERMGIDSYVYLDGVGAKKIVAYCKHLLKLKGYEELSRFLHDTNMNPDEMAEGQSSEEDDEEKEKMSGADAEEDEGGGSSGKQKDKESDGEGGTIPKKKKDSNGEGETVSNKKRKT